MISDCTESTFAWLLNMKKQILLILFCFQLLSAEQDLLREDLSESYSREWTDLENQVFALALCRVQSFLVSQQGDFLSLKISLCQLKNELIRIVEDQYESVVKPKTADSMRICKQYKQFLLSTCFTYYLLMYFSNFYDENSDHSGYIQYLREPFLALFFSGFVEDLDFTEYKKQNWKFSMAHICIQFSMPYPEKVSFFILGSIFLNSLWEYSFLDLFVQMKKMLRISYREESLQQFLLIESVVFQQVDEFEKEKDPQEEEKRDWDFAEQKTLVIAMSLVRKRLVYQEQGLSIFKKNILDLQDDLITLFDDQYLPLKKKHDQPEYSTIYIHDQYKSFLLSTCLSYYLLMYFSLFYDEESPSEDIKLYIEDVFLGVFFDELLNNLDFEEYQMVKFNFALDHKRKALQLVCPSGLSFLILSDICYQTLLDDDESTIIKQMSSLLNILFDPHVSKKFFHTKTLLNSY